MRALGAATLPATHHLLAQAHPRLVSRIQGTRLLQTSPSQDLQPTQAMLVQVFDGVEQITVESHGRPSGQAT
jgi:hypothetical protein